MKEVLIFEDKIVNFKFKKIFQKSKHVFRQVTFRSVPLLFYLHPLQKGMNNTEKCTFMQYYRSCRGKKQDYFDFSSLIITEDNKKKNVVKNDQGLIFLLFMFHLFRKS